MIKLMRQFVVIAMLAVASVGAFAQRKDQDKRPPKEPAVIISNKNQRPPQNSNQQQPKRDKPKRP